MFKRFFKVPTIIHPKNGHNSVFEQGSGANPDFRVEYSDSICSRVEEGPGGGGGRSLDIPFLLLDGSTSRR